MPENLQEYQEACCRARQSLNAQGVFMVVVNGSNGTAFATSFNSPLEDVERFVVELRALADDLEGGKIKAVPQYHMCPPKLPINA